MTKTPTLKEVAASSGIRWLCVVLLLCFIAGETAGERGRERPPDECGDPRRISQSYKVYEGTVVKVVDGDTLVVDIRGREIEFEGVTYTSSLSGRTTVQLVCLDAPPLTEPIGIESKQRLSARLLGKQVTVWISPYQEDGAPLNVMVLLQGGHPIDENVEQLEQGLARFRYFGPHALDSWMRCQYERAQERAQKAKIGVWTN